MQDRYVGDVGDFVKYGLLRAIKGQKRLGVAWYLNPYAGPRPYGQHTEHDDAINDRTYRYLKQRDQWRHLDPELFDNLEKLVGDDDRSVEAVQKSGVLGNAVFAAEPLDIYRVPWRERRHWRRRWFERTRSLLSDCDLILADPDNGLVPDERFRPEQKKNENEKRIPLAEVNALAEGRSVIVYHHNSRRGNGHRSEIRDWMDRLPGCVFAYYWRRVSNRTFFVIDGDDGIEHRLRRFAEIWKHHGELVCKRGAARFSPGSRRGSVAETTALAPGGQPSMRAAELEPDPVVEAYKRDIDRTLLRQNLRRSVTERVANLMALQRLAVEARRAGRARERNS